MPIDKTQGYRLNPIEVVAFHLYKLGSWKDPSPTREIVSRLWKMDRMIPILMGGCPQERHESEDHHALILKKHVFPCRMCGPIQWYIFKIVKRALGDFPVMLYNLAGDDGGFRPLGYDVLNQITKIQQRRAVAQIDETVAAELARKADARQESLQGIRGVLDEHIDGMRREFSQFNTATMPTDPPEKARHRRIWNTYRNERTAGE